MAPFGDIQRLNRLLGGTDQLDVMFIENVHQRDEALGLVPPCKGQGGNVIQYKSMETARQGEVIQRPQRSVA